MGLLWRSHHRANALCARRFAAAVNGPRSNNYSVSAQASETELLIDGVTYAKDSWTNVTPRVLSHVGRNLHRQPGHPLSLIKRRIVNYFDKSFRLRPRTPLFTSIEDLHPVVTVEQNFDSLLVPKDHPSRSKQDCYYVNEKCLLRAHTSAHQLELIRMGMNNFLLTGDVYRRDEIDRSHYPVFHQLEGVRTMTKHQIFRDDGLAAELPVFENGGTRTAEKQECHTLDAVYIVSRALKATLEGLSQDLFGKGTAATEDHSW